jgi:predicted transcriptional regulator
VKAPGPIKSARAESEDDLPGITVEAGPYMLHEELDYEPAGDYDPAVDGAPKGVVPYDPTEMPVVKLETDAVPKKRTVLRPLKGKTGAELQVELFGSVVDVKPIVTSAPAPARSCSDSSSASSGSASDESDCSSSSESEGDRAPRRKKRKSSSSRSQSPVRRKLSSASVKKYVDSLSAKERARQRKELKAYMESAAAKLKKKKADKRRREKEELRTSPKRKRSGRDSSPVYEGSSRGKSREIATSSVGRGGSSKKTSKCTKVRNMSIFLEQYS